MFTAPIRRAGLASIRNARSFTTTPRAFVRVGDKIPDMTCLAEGSPGNKVNMAEEVGNGKALIIGVPAAFSTCDFIPFAFRVSGYAVPFCSLPN